ncbi:MAG TPA: cupredoxin domain-containing protein [Candidatus Nanoarchaeia archaeon]|nr:cupredoxin domain-containing protein [Candidatus Nanoarchaeia archaeon]
MKKRSYGIVIMLVLSLLLLTACSRNNSENNLQSAAVVEEKGSAEEQGRIIALDAYNWGFTPTEIKVKQGEVITLKIKSTSGVHGVGSRELGLSSGIIAEGEEKSVTFTADKKGTFGFYCNVYCGDGHGEMKGKIVVE